MDQPLTSTLRYTIFGVEYLAVSEDRTRAAYRRITEEDLVEGDGSPDAVVMRAFWSSRDRLALQDKEREGNE